ncbi:hypothetical protein M3Y99_00771100 [Aphelenchoides fujianensis]|nr:hypothetical protein M3Y99_00771100 [Aphelenchoides fujianensis]
MSARLPILNTSRSSGRNSTRPKASARIVETPVLPPIESPKHDPEAVWQRLHSKVSPIVLPRVFIDARHLEEEEAEHRKLLDSLPNQNADFVQKVDFFAKFLDENHVNVEKMSEFHKFTKFFCLVHGGFEKKQRLYYALIARRAVKMRQIQAVQDEMRGYEKAAAVLDELAAKNKADRLSESQLSGEFNRMIEEQKEA